MMIWARCFVEREGGRLHRRPYAFVGPFFLGKNGFKINYAVADSCEEQRNPIQRGKVVLSKGIPLWRIT